MTRFVEVGSDGTEATGEGAILRAAEWLRECGLLAHPTSTVYGIGALPGGDRDGAVNLLKGRSPDQPLIHVAADIETLRRSLPRLAWSSEARRLADAFWPGPLTLVLPLVDDRDQTRGEGGHPGQAVRIESHPVLRGVLQELGDTMTSTSLNASGRPPARSGAEALDILENLPGDGARLGLLDAGELPDARGSTMVALTTGRPRLLRQGALDYDRVLDAIDMNRDEKGVAP